MLANKLLGSSAAVDANYIEDVFSTYLYTGNGSTQTITNGIDLAGKGGMVWIKDRNSGAKGHALFDTVRGVNRKLQTQSTAAEFYNAGVPYLPAFNVDGFSLGSPGDTNDSAYNYASWTFRKQPKFFDVVTWTGTGGNTTIPHNLGSVPGCIIIKGTNSTLGWKVYHRSTGNTTVLNLNLTDAAYSGIPTYWNSTTPTSTVFSLGTDASVNASGNTYVAYLFAHNAGGFGATGTDNVVSCGSFTTDGSGNATVNLGYEPQWVMVKGASGGSSVDQWRIVDAMRGFTVEGVNDAQLLANTSSAEFQQTRYAPTATGFTATEGASTTYIYIAIRRGPMKVPTDGTKVFAPVSTASSASPLTVTTNFPVDASIYTASSINDQVMKWSDRLRGGSSSGTTRYLELASTEVELSKGAPAFLGFDSNVALIDSGYLSGSSISKIYWNFRRAPSFFDVVCYTGTGVARTVAHNLAVVPELMIVKRRDGGWSWTVYSPTIGNTSTLNLNTIGAVNSPDFVWNSTTPTASVFSLGIQTAVNASASTYVNYLFATCPGVSKVGSYTGTGTTQTINCGFSAGSRFVLIKRTNSTGDWYVWDSARGIVSANDPHLSLNSTAAEVTTDDSVDPTSSGFIVNQVAATNINVSGASYLFLAIS